MKRALLQQGMKILLLVCFFCMGNTSEARIYYVNSTATGTGDGSSWLNAFTDPQAAIDAASPGDTVCVAQGIYSPTHLLGLDSVRNVTFYIDKSISLYGGFSGVAGTEGNFTDRNPGLHVTTLSGETGLSGDDSDNVFHVVYFDHVSDSTRMDGFVVANGSSIDGGGLDGTGAGIFNNATSGRSHPVIANCIIRNNIASENGGGMLNYAPDGGNARPQLINCTIIQNSASGGGGISNYTDTEGQASPLLINCSLMGNTARTADGGAMNSIAHSSTATPAFINCIITGNHSPNSAAFQSFATGTGIGAPEFINCAFSGNTGGAIRVVDLGAQSSVVTIRNTIVFGNGGGIGISTNGATADASFSIIPFGFPGEGIIGLDPLFISQPPLDSANTEGDLHLQDASPAIDAGKNADVPAGILTDLDNQPRFVNPANGQAGTVDIGPYEIQSITTGITDFLSDADWAVYPNPAKEQIAVDIPETGVHGELRLLDSRGTVMTTQQLNTGKHELSMDVSGLPAGIYFVHLLLDGLQDVKKIMVSGE